MAPWLHIVYGHRSIGPWKFICAPYYFPWDKLSPALTMFWDRVSFSLNLSWTCWVVRIILNPPVSTSQVLDYRHISPWRELSFLSVTEGVEWLSWASHVVSTQWLSERQLDTCYIKLASVMTTSTPCMPCLESRGWWIFGSAGRGTVDLMFSSDLLEAPHQPNGFGILFKGTGSSWLWPTAWYTREDIFPLRAHWGDVDQ